MRYQFMRYPGGLSKAVTLSYDDGAKADARLAQTLNRYGLKCTFNLLSSRVKTEEGLTKDFIRTEILAKGHEIATHGYSHRNMARMSRAQCEEEWERTERVLTGLGAEAELFRPPSGAYGQTLVEGARERGYHIILWDVDPRDWQVPSADTIAERILKEVRPGSVILLHDGQYPVHSADALRKVADRLKADGYSFVTVGEMLGISSGRAE